MRREAIRVLVVDDSVVVRRALRSILVRDPHVGAVETAVNGEIALRKLARFDPDVVTMDVEMPEMDGLAALGRIMDQWPRPVIMLSGHTYEGAAKTIRALELGAVDFIQKPGGAVSGSMEAIARRLLSKIKSVAASRVTRRRLAAAGARVGPRLRTSPLVSRCMANAVVGIGASTGGTQAIRAVLECLPADFPSPILIVQHMPPGFTRAFADRLDELCALEVKEAAHRDLIRPGRALLAPGHSHMVAKTEAGVSYVELDDGAEVNGHRPSVDVLFDSMAGAFGRRAAVVLLTGMGRDGAVGVKNVHDGGGSTFAQDEASSVIFGMPKAAIKLGGVQHVVPLGDVAESLVALGGGSFGGESR